MKAFTFEEKDPRGRMIVALDSLDKAGAIAMIDLLAPYVGMFKLGLEMINLQVAGYLAQYCAERGIGVFWDIKIHDIPQTAFNTAKVIAATPGISMFNLHCLGTVKMMEAARKGAIAGCPEGDRRPLVIGVTVLTSADESDLRSVGIRERRTSRESTEVVMQRTVRRLALAALESNLDGVVASPKETAVIRRECGASFKIITPGVRPQGSMKHDQERVLTPREAIEQGSDMLVMGRPLTSPENGTPVDAAKRVAEEIASAL